MRSTIKWNENWEFFKGVSDVAVNEGGEHVNLPHSWNAVDGQDGGNDYFRGDCIYKKSLLKADLPADTLCYLEINGANSSADVYVNGEKLAHHDGGYSTWRVNITDALQAENEIAILVNNAPNETVYPQMADFTFYGGLYRDVNLICVPNTHFDLDYFGGTGLMVTPVMDGEDAHVMVKTFLTNAKEGDELVYTIYDMEGWKIVQGKSSEDEMSIRMNNVRLWQGRKDPYLYSCKVELMRGEEVLDSVSTRFGCRSFAIDPDRGFILNGEEYPLRGVSRHQDRWG